MNSTKRMVTLGVTALLSFSSTVLLAGDKPSIISTEPIYTTSPHQLTVVGTGFGASKPVVKLCGGQGYDDRDDTDAALIDVTLGAVGPTGQTGPGGSSDRPA